MSGILTLAITTFNRPSACFSCIHASIQYISSLKLSIDLLVIDDCSTVTEELNILYKYLDLHNIPCIRHPFNHGLAASRNTAISHCRTDWIAFCDDDDIWSEKSFTLFSSAILRANKLHAQMILGLTSPSLPLCSSRNHEPISRLSDLFIMGITPPPSSQIFNMSLFTEVQNYNTDIKSGVDHDIWVSLLGSTNPNVLIFFDPGVNVSNSLVNRMTTDYHTRSNALQFSLSSWKPVITKHLSEDFYFHFVDCYNQSLNYQFCIQFLKKGKYLEFLRLLFSRKIFLRLLRRLFLGPVSRINYFDSFRVP